MPTDPRTLLRNRSHLQLLVLAAILGVPVSAAAYGFLALVNGGPPSPRGGDAAACCTSAW